MYAYLAKLSYLGKNYAGWQLQVDEPTIQGALEKALLQLFAKDDSERIICRGPQGQMQVFMRGGNLQRSLHPVSLNLSPLNQL